mgnify:CR=1 FL=1
MRESFGVLVQSEKPPLVAVRMIWNTAVNIKCDRKVSHTVAYHV